jgi:hypothetical protein
MPVAPFVESASLFGDEQESASAINTLNDVPTPALVSVLRNVM